MSLFSRPAFYVIAILLFLMVFLTAWLQWKVGQISEQKAKQETAPAAVSKGP